MTDHPQPGGTRRPSKRRYAGQGTQPRRCVSWPGNRRSWKGTQPTATGLGVHSGGPSGGQLRLLVVPRAQESDGPRARSDVAEVAQKSRGHRERRGVPLREPVAARSSEPRSNLPPYRPPHRLPNPNSARNLPVGPACSDPRPNRPRPQASVVAMIRRTKRNSLSLSVLHL